MQFDHDLNDRRLSNRLHENDDEYDVPDEESNIQSNYRGAEKSLERNTVLSQGHVAPGDMNSRLER